MFKDVCVCVWGGEGGLALVVYKFPVDILTFNICNGS